MSEFIERKEPLESGLSQAQIDRLIELRKLAGAVSCSVVTEEGQQYLVCRYPAGG